MPVLGLLLLPLQLWNDVVLRIGRAISIVAMALMVAAILTQVFFRYLGDTVIFDLLAVVWADIPRGALPWPDEAARFCMLWLTGLMAPIAYRQGGFVAIDLVVRALPERVGAVVSLFLLLIAGLVLYVAMQIGWSEVTGFGGRFATASLYVPVAFDFSEWMRVPRSWMMASLLVGVVLLLIVNVELILRSLIALFGGADSLRPVPGTEDAMGAE